MAAYDQPILTTGETTTTKRSVVDLIDLVDPTAVPFLKTVSPGMSNLTLPCRNTKYEFPEDTMPIIRTTVQTAIEATNSTQFYVAAGYGEYILEGFVLQIDDEQMLVGTKGTAADLVTVSRAHGGTTGATHAAAAVVQIVNRISVERPSSATTDSATTPTMPYNNVQLMLFPLEISLLEANNARYGIEDQWRYQAAKRLEYAMQIFEIAMFWSTRVDWAASTAGSMGGIETYIPSANKEDHSAAPLTEKAINLRMKAAFETVGTPYLPKVLMCGAYHKAKISEIYAPYGRMERAERTGGIVVDRIETDFGPLDVMVSLHSKSDRILFVNTDFVKVGPQEGLGWHIRDLPALPASDVNELVGVYTAEFRNAKCHQILYNISETN